MSSPESPQSSSPFELRWRLFGISFCIAPSFWIVNALMGWLILSMSPMGGNYWVNLGLWVLCTLISVVVHEMGHVLVGRFFGQPGSIMLAGMGGQASGKYEQLTPKQRIAVAAAGPSAGFLFLAALVLLDEIQWNWLWSGWLAGWITWNPESHWSILSWYGGWPREDRYFQNAMRFLIIMNLFWNLLNLLPIFPMDGGMIFREICTIISPKGGPIFAYGFSFLVSALVAIYCILQLAQAYGWLKALPPLPSIGVWPPFGVIMFGMLAVQNFFLLWQETVAQRAAHYQQRFDD